ncbi:Aquaporin-4 [Echinococcus granulosus]|uniref:Aquaporin-4 n=2 Tax=Echinococcus granulosus TaxID=6210 RepID=W6UIK9_ECHGR|nr:Aquaporin-4 [Echinococcus granulosus]EUB60918.1 Aquaporin-4 [Echinococcus granulosus]
MSTLHQKDKNWIGYITQERKTSWLVSFLLSETHRVPLTPNIVWQVQILHPSTMTKNPVPSIYWNLFQIFVCEAVAAGIPSLPCFLLPNPINSPDIVVPLIFGISVSVALWITGATSGGHINPMVTLAAAVTRRVQIIYVPAYIVGQFTGALIAMGIAWWVSPFRPQEPNNFGLTLPGANVSNGAAIVIEMVATLTLILVVLASLDEVRDQSWRLDTCNNFPLILLVVITANMALTIPISGGSMNPTRSIAAAIYQQNYDRQWIYFIGPPVGCLLACFLYEIIICPFSSLRRTRMWLTSHDFDRHCKYDTDAADDLGNS